jgi:hypothetical protein
MAQTAQLKSADTASTATGAAPRAKRQRVDFATRVKNQLSTTALRGQISTEGLQDVKQHIEKLVSLLG